MNRICVFSGSCYGILPEYKDVAIKLGTLIGEREMDIVYGGTNIGLMGVVAEAARQAGANVIGIIPQFFVDKGLAHNGDIDLRIVQSMHERKALMLELSDAFISLPGGFGTFEEFFEIITLAQLEMHQKPCGLLNTLNFYTKLIEFLKTVNNMGFIKKEHLKMILFSNDPKILLDTFINYSAPVVDKWR